MDREIYYRPILDDNEHLLRSSTTPGRYRGLSRDSNNENPDIPEWEEITFSDDHEGSDGTAIGVAVGIAFVLGYFTKEYIVPLVKQLPILKIGRTDYNETESVTKSQIPSNEIEAANRIDEYFDDFVYQMSPEEAQAHMLKIRYHLLCLEQEIQDISNSIVRETKDSDEDYMKKIEHTKKTLIERVAHNLNNYLSGGEIHFDDDTSKEMIALLGGGARMEGIYVPITPESVREALLTISHSDNESILLSN